MQASISRLFILFAFSVSLLLSGCGFHLRGQIDVPESLMRMHVKGNDIDLVDEVTKSLKFSDIEIVEEAEPGVAVLDLTDTTYRKEVNGTDNNGIATSYKLTYTVNYVVYDPSEEVLQQQSVKQSRILAYDAGNILLFEREESYLKEEMRTDLVSFILRRMSKIQ